MTVATEIGARLRAERHRLGLAQDSMALLAGKAGGTQANWEKGEASPNAADLAAFADAGADILFIVTGRREIAPDAGVAAVVRANLALIAKAQSAYGKSAD